MNLSFIYKKKKEKKKNKEVRENKSLDLLKGEKICQKIFFFWGINRFRKVNEDIEEERELERYKIKKKKNKLT